MRGGRPQIRVDEYKTRMAEAPYRWRALGGLELNMTCKRRVVEAARGPSTTITSPAVTSTQALLVGSPEEKSSV